MASDWSASNSWTQKTTSADAGENQVKVQIRDGNHAAEDGYDGETTALFTISELLLNISGMAYQDKNGNSILDEGEGLAGWTIKLTKPDGSELCRHVVAGRATVERAARRRAPRLTLLSASPLRRL